MPKKVSWTSSDLDDELPELSSVPRPTTFKKKTKKLVQEVDFSPRVLTAECPVCRSLEDCPCEEGDRDFVLRTRNEGEASKVPTCPSCGAPKSVVYLKKPGKTGAGGLKDYSSLWACGGCYAESLASVLLMNGGRDA